MNIGERIQSARKQKGLTQKELAQKLGLATGTIQQYELNKRQPRMELLKEIASVLDVEVGYLLGFSSVNFELVQAIKNNDVNEILNILGLNSEALSVFNRRAREKKFLSNLDAQAMIEKFDLLSPEWQQLVLKHTNSLIDGILKTLDSSIDGGIKNAIHPQDDK